MEETRKVHDQLSLRPPKFSEAGEKMMREHIKELSEGMFQPKKPIIIQNEKAKKIDLLLKLIAQYQKESFDPITGNLYANALDEREWLLNKGYFIENSELKEL